MPLFLEKFLNENIDAKINITICAFSNCVTAVLKKTDIDIMIKIIKS
jgi:hypothetical protein